MTALRNLLVALTLLLWAVPADAANRFGVCTVTCTWDNSSTAMWSTSTGGTTGASAPTSADSVTLDAATCVGGVTCTITVNANLDIQALAMGACTASTTGCILDFSVNNNNVTFGSGGFSGAGTGTRNIKMGNGTWTITSTGNAWIMNTITNLTFNANSSTIVFTATTASVRTFHGGGLTYNDLSISANTGLGAMNITGSNTFAHLAVTTPNFLVPALSTTQTISNAFTWAGSSSAQIGIASSFAGSAATISVPSGAPTMGWASVRDITFTGGATFTATNSFNIGGNSGITITAPSTGGGGGGRIIGGSLSPDKMPTNDNAVCDHFVGKLPMLARWKKCAA